MSTSPPATGRWDVFLSESAKVLRDLSAEEVRSARVRGEVHDDDLVRPAGGGRSWTPIFEFPELAPGAGPSPDEMPTVRTPAATDSGAITERSPTLEPPPGPSEGGSTPTIVAHSERLTPTEHDAEPDSFILDDEDESLNLDALLARTQEDLPPASPTSYPDVDLTQAAPAVGPVSKAPTAPMPPPLIAEEADAPYAEIVDDFEEDDRSITLDARKAPEEIPDEDEAATSFTLTRGSTDHVEELDLAAMVDVALQLVLFFIVTAQVVVFKSMEIPTPAPEAPEAAAVSPEPPPPDELEKEFITIGISPAGEVTINDEPVTAEFQAIAARLRSTRDETGLRRILINADAAARHRHTILAIDAAQEVGLEIALARPVPN